MPKLPEMCIIIPQSEIPCHASTVSRGSLPGGFCQSGDSVNRSPVNNVTAAVTVISYKVLCIKYFV